MNHANYNRWFLQYKLGSIKKLQGYYKIYKIYRRNPTAPQYNNS